MRLSAAAPIACLTIMQAAATPSIKQALMPPWELTDDLPAAWKQEQRGRAGQDSLEMQQPRAGGGRHVSQRQHHTATHAQRTR